MKMILLPQRLYALPALAAAPAVGQGRPHLQPGQRFRHGAVTHELRHIHCGKRSKPAVSSASVLSV